MIKIQNLKKIYNGTTVLDIESLDIAPGELVGLVGNNGAGKTTLLRLVLDLIKADDGFVESDGKKVNESEDWKTYTRKIKRMGLFQPSVIPSYLCWQQLREMQFSESKSKYHKVEQERVELSAEGQSHNT